MEKLPDLYIDERINSLLTVFKLSEWDISIFVDPYDEYIEYCYDLKKENLVVTIYIRFIDDEFSACSIYVFNNNVNGALRTIEFINKEEFSDAIEKVVEWV